MTDLIKHNIHEKSRKTLRIALCDCLHQLSFFGSRELRGGGVELEDWHFSLFFWGWDWEGGGELVRVRFWLN